MTDHPPRTIASSIDTVAAERGEYPPAAPPTPPVSLEEIERRVQAELGTALDLVERQPPYDPTSVAALGTLAATLRNVHQARATPLDTPTPPSPPFDVDTLCARVWNAVQDAGAPTSASDAAVDAIREVASGEA